MLFQENLNEASNEFEERLIENIATGDSASFEKIVALYQVKIRSFASIYADKLGEEVDDIAQDVFFAIFKSAKRFKKQSSVKTWVLSIAKFTISNKLRKKKLLYFWQFSEKARHEVFEAHESLLETNHSELIVELEQDKAIVKQCLLELPTKYHEVLFLLEFENMTYEQISKVLGIKVGTVKSRIFSARTLLSKKVHQYYES